MLSVPLCLCVFCCLPDTPCTTMHAIKMFESCWLRIGCRDSGGDWQKKTSLKDTKTVWRTAESCMLKHMEKCAAPIGFSQRSPRYWDLGNRINCYVIMWMRWGQRAQKSQPMCRVFVYEQSQQRAVEGITKVPKMKCSSFSLFVSEFENLM